MTLSPPHVHNTNVEQHRVCVIDYMCIKEDSLGHRNRLVAELAAAWNTARFGAVLQPSEIMPLVHVSPWSQTSGKENLSGIVVPMEGNRANWIDVQTQRFQGKRTLPTYESATPYVSDVYELPTGFVRYVYNRIDDLVALVQSTSVAPRAVGSMRTMGGAMRTKTGLSVDLGESANVSITKASGEHVVTSMRLAARRHELSVGAAHGLLLVRLGNEGRSMTIPVVR